MNMIFALFKLALCLALMACAVFAVLAFIGFSLHWGWDFAGF